MDQYKTRPVAYSQLTGKNNQILSKQLCFHSNFIASFTFYKKYITMLEQDKHETHSNLNITRTSNC